MKNGNDPEKINYSPNLNSDYCSLKKHSYFEIIFNSKNSIMLSLYENIEDYSYSSIYYFYKGIQYELGIFKNKSLSIAKEFYVQGANINQSLCFYRLYYILSLQEEENSKSGNETQDTHLYFLLKYLSYYDNSSSLNYLISESEIIDLKNKIKLNYDKIKSFISNKNNQDTFCISQSELEYLSICLENFGKCSDEKNINLNTNLLSIIMLYKETKHEEALYQIIDYCLKNNEINFLNKFFTEKLTKKNDLSSKNLVFLIINYLQGHKINIKIEKQIFTSLKIGGNHEIIAALKCKEITYKDLANIFEDENNIKNLKNKLLKIIKSLYSSVIGGDVDSIPQLFYIVIFLTKQVGDMKIMYESKIVEDILDFLEKTYDKLPYKKELNFLLGIFHLRGIKIKKDYRRSKEIFEQIYHNEKNYWGQSDFLLFIIYYIIKINHKLSNFEESKIYTEQFFKLILSKQSLIKNPQIAYLIAKLYLKNNQLDQSYNILSETLKFFKGENSELISFIDKIYLFKINKFLLIKKEYRKYKPILFSNSQKNENFNLCNYCEFRNKEVMAVPCGHKFICTECYEDKEEYFEFDNFKCQACGKNIESALKKVFN